MLGNKHLLAFTDQHDMFIWEASFAEKKLKGTITIIKLNLNMNFRNFLEPRKTEDIDYITQVYQVTF